MTDPYPPPPSAPVRRRPRRATPIWFWLAVSAGTVALIGGVLFVTGSLPGGPATADRQAGSAAGTPASSATTADGRAADPDGWEACGRLRDLGATTFDSKLNQSVGQLARRSTHEEIAARGAALVKAATLAPAQDPIDANLAISRAQLDLTEACERVFGGSGR